MYIYMHVITVKKIAHEFDNSKEGFKVQKGKREMKLYYNLKNKNLKIYF